MPVEEGNFLAVLSGGAPEGGGMLPPRGNSSRVEIRRVEHSLVLQVVHVVSYYAVVLGIPA